MELPKWWMANKPYKMIDSMGPDGMPQIPDNSVDMVLTSPPFRDEDVSDDYYKWLYDVLLECRRISPIVVMFNSSKRIVDICRRHNPRRILIWDKKRTEGAYRYEPIFIFADENMKINKGIWNDCLAYIPILGKNQSVPYENPIELYTSLIRFFPGTKIVLDPFLGSGTTLLACRRVKKIGLGYEINPEFEDVIKQKSTGYPNDLRKWS